jgi:hypothetical protein
MSAAAHVGETKDADLAAAAEGFGEGCAAFTDLRSAVLPFVVAIGFCRMLSVGEEVGFVGAGELAITFLFEIVALVSGFECGFEGCRVTRFERNSPKKVSRASMNVPGGRIWRGCRRGGGGARIRRGRRSVMPKQRGSSGMMQSRASNRPGIP